MPDQPSAPAQTSPALQSALRHLLRPLVRLLVRHGITFPQLSSLLKEIYVESAREDFAPPGGQLTDSRVTLLTGVHRKDVKRLREQAHVERSPAPRSLSLGAHVISLWTGDRLYTDEHHQPLPLPRTGDAPSFESLVRSVSTDIRPGAVLHDWLERGLAHVDDNDRIVLNESAFVPRTDLDELAYYLGRNLHDHIATCDYNLAAQGSAQIERAVYYDQLSPESVQELEALAREQGMQALLAVNRAARALAERDRKRTDANRRMSFGVYFHTPREPGGEQD